MTAPEHSTHIGYRTMRTVDGAQPQMPFARCVCGWEGPSRIKRSAAVEDGMQHIFTPDQAGKAPNLPDTA